MELAELKHYSTKLQYMYNKNGSASDQMLQIKKIEDCLCCKKLKKVFTHYGGIYINFTQSPQVVQEILLKKNSFLEGLL